MRIYIDEAGLFVVPRSGSDSFSLVLSLVVPSTTEAELFYDFLRLRDEWPVKGIEIKGSTLDESQTAQVIEVCLRHDVLVEFLAVNMTTHDQLLVENFKRGQADELMAHLTPQHKPDIVRSLKQMSDRIHKMPNQLFLQAFVTVQLLLELMPEALLYYVQRMPEELGDIAWIIDRKDRTLTQMEEMWSRLILPFSESYYAKERFHCLAGGDYSHFHKRYSSQRDNMAPETARHMEWVREHYGVRALKENDYVVNANKLFNEQRDFKDSKDDLGLQLADILATMLRRALNGNLQEAGWKDFGGLIVRRRDIGSYFMQMGRGGSVIMPEHAASVCRILDARAKSMLVPD